MKKITILITLLLYAASLFAQAPENFTYQAVVRNASNALVANAQVGVRVNILQGTASGNAVYSETHIVNTNANGLVTVNIGGGSVLHGSFADIDWSDGPYFLKTDIDPNGGNDYSITSVQQLLSVPYALYAKEAGNVPTVPTNVSAFTNDAGYITAQEIPTIPTIPTNVSAFTNDAGYLTSYTETDPQFNAWDKDYNDLINKPAIPNVPTNVSAFANDAGYITSYTETDPQYNAWDKDYNDLINKPTIPTVPTNVSAFTNDAGYITQAQVPVPVNADWSATTGAALILNKPNLFSGDYNDLINKPVLFSGNYNDLTNKPTLFDGNYNSLTNRPNLAAVALSGSYNDLINKPAIPTAVGELTNNVGYITLSQVPAQVNADWNATTGAAQILNKPTLFSGNYNDLTNLPQIPQIPADISAFNNDAGYITEDDLPDIPTVPTNVSAFTNDAGYLTSYTETDPQFNAWDKDYNDLTNKPTIPTVPTNVSAFTNDAGYLTSFTEQQVLSISHDTLFLTGGSFVKLPAGFDGDYNSLTNKPTIPTVPTNVSAFSNDAGYITMDSVPSIPTNVSAFINDIGYLTTANVQEAANIPSNVSAFYNDAGYITMDSVPTIPTMVSNFINDAGYLTEYTETDPQFSAWNKDYNDLINTPAMPTIPTNISAFFNDVGYLMDEAQTLADVTAQGNSAGNRQLKDVSDPTESYDAVNMHTLNWMMDSLRAEFLQMFQHQQEQIDSLEELISSLQPNSACHRIKIQPLYAEGQPESLCPTYGVLTLVAIDSVTGEKIPNLNYTWSGESVDVNVSTKDTAFITIIPEFCNHLYTVQLTVEDTVTTCMSNATYSVYSHSSNGPIVTNGVLYNSTAVNRSSDGHYYVPDFSNLLDSSNVSDNCYPFSAISITQSPSAGTLMTQYTTVTIHLNTPCGGSNTYHVQLSLYNDFDTVTYPNTNCTAPCNGQCVIFHAPVGLRYTLTGDNYTGERFSQVPGWDTNVTENTLIFDYLNTGLYMLSISDLFGTTTERTIFIRNNLSIPTFGANEVTVIQPSGNANGEITISPVGGFSYSLLNEEGDTISFTNLPNGTYTLKKVNMTTRCSVDSIITLSMGIPPGDAQPCPGTPTVTDHEGNVYNTVKIGNQCWTKENMRCVTSPSTGTYLIPTTGTTYTYSGKQARWYNNDSATYAPINYGLLYNWNAAVDTFNTEYGETSVVTSSNYAVNAILTGKRRGICPEGWHVPSDAEWAELVTYVSNQHAYISEYDTYHDSTWIAKALSLDTLWSTNISTCAVGNDVSSNNLTQFSAVPAGISKKTNYTSGSSTYEFRYSKNHAYFWSSTQNGTNAKSRYMVYDAPDVKSDYSDHGAAKGMGMSVRCLRDETPGVETPDPSTACQNIKIIKDVRNGAIEPYCPNYGDLTIVAVDAATETKIPNLIYTWSGESVNVNASIEDTSFIVIVPDYCDWHYTAYVHVVDSVYGCVGDAQITVWAADTAGPVYTGDIINDTVAIDSQCKMYVPDFIHYLNNANVIDNCYSFSEFYETFRQEPPAGTEMTEDTPVTIYVTTPCQMVEYPIVNKFFARVPENACNTVIDSKSCPGTPTVTDHEGNVYATVQIGNQCWMRDNLRTTTSPSTGTYLIPSPDTNYTYTGKQARWYNNDSATYAPMKYGLLYNWNAAVDTFNTAYGETSVITSSYYAVSVTFNSRRRGVCPVGWHLPSQGEWMDLFQYVGNQSNYLCGNNSNYIAKALASTTGWSSSTNNCAVGNTPGSNNATGFSAVPAGFHSVSSFYSSGDITYFWSSTRYSSSNAYGYYLGRSYADVDGGVYGKGVVYSVRCLRD